MGPIRSLHIEKPILSNPMRIVFIINFRDLDRIPTILYAKELSSRN